MTENAHWLEPAFGKRLGAWRRHRGFRTAAALADRIAEQGGSMTEAVIQNLESGRKADPTVSQLLSLSRALGVPPIALLAPLGNPVAHVPLTGSTLGDMAAFQIDAWWSVGEASIDEGLPDVSIADRDVLRALRVAVRARAEYNGWSLRHTAALEAGDVAGAAEAYQETMRTVSTLFNISKVLADSGLPFDWLRLGGVPEIKNLVWSDELVDSPNQPEGDDAAAADTDR